MHGAGAYAEGKIQVVAQAVGKVELGGRKGNVVFGDTQHCFAIILGAVHHVVLEVNAALGETGAAGAIKPEGAVVFAGLGRFEAARCFIDPLFEVMYSWR